MVFTLRDRLGIERAEGELIPVIGSKDNVENAFEKLKNKRIVVAYDSELSKEGDIVKGGFRGGLVSNIKFYDDSNSPFGFNAHIWFNGQSFAMGLRDIYDVVVIGNSRKKSSANDFKVYEFRQSWGEGSEYSLVIHKNPFDAYNLLLKKGGVSVEQRLTDVKKIASCVLFNNREDSPSW